MKNPLTPVKNRVVAIKDSTVEMWVAATYSHKAYKRSKKELRNQMKIEGLQLLMQDVQNAPTEEDLNILKSLIADLREASGGKDGILTDSMQATLDEFKAADAARVHVSATDADDNDLDGDDLLAHMLKRSAQSEATFAEQMLNLRAGTAALVAQNNADDARLDAVETRLEEAARLLDINKGGETS